MSKSESIWVCAMILVATTSRVRDGLEHDIEWTLNLVCTHTLKVPKGEEIQGNL
jgi:hypothetical protein